jgi:hypothetical protein
MAQLSAKNQLRCKMYTMRLAPGITEPDGLILHGNYAPRKTVAISMACINNVRRYRLPRLETRPKIDLPGPGQGGSMSSDGDELLHAVTIPASPASVTN